MGKAARRARKNADAAAAAPKVIPAPYVARPFAGLAGETDWVALREIVPAATGTARIDLSAPAVREAVDRSGRGDGAAQDSLTVATVLPMAWAGLRRADGDLLLGLQSGGNASGDPSRDLALVVLELLATEDGNPVAGTPRAGFDAPRLQDILVTDAPFEVTMHETFDFWMAEGTELDAEGSDSLARANETIIPMVKLEAAPSAYWCRIGERVYLRWLLPYDEDAATNALARLHATRADTLGEETRLLGAFRAAGLLAPVWELDPERDPSAYDAPLATLNVAFAEALQVDAPLTADERRAKSGLLSRQLTLR